MSLSYWEIESWLSDVDYCVVGSGITGLTCALELRALHPGARILVLERGVLPSGASTRNAGFACFGSLTEILDDQASHSDAEIAALVSDRYLGIQRLRERLGDQAIDYRPYGGYEVFLDREAGRFEAALDSMDRINDLLSPVFGRPAFEIRREGFGMQGILPDLICNRLEGQLDTGRMMQALIAKTTEAGITILNGVEVTGFEDQGDRVVIGTRDFEFAVRHLLLATNGFAGPLTGLEISPARGQVLVTQPVPGLKLRGSFHLQEGYFYFRNVGERILLGGGRHLDKAGETTTDLGQTPGIQQALEDLLGQVILPGKSVAIAHRWSGIMGVGSQKKPIVKKLSTNVACGVRLGGMGVAIGSHVGESLARLVNT
ncbi:FAD-binding oxidoreductase [Robiginitalea sp. SC105]|uniref:NAD(P)/FAD-dependent oxidoreductase n=1 Tax=Robiginitalea sp. SC105 TaxID=2762332 RepID=UPI00163B43C8|nr:FAD-dependent oxidoreductase [Robiginitalea sp. SC105]MBC2838097.1 FAD-binding oxidoreductase [Robiginitalea sp. SC105]